MNNLLISILLLVSSQITESRLRTLEDYTLYFDEYHFQWSNAQDWHVISADNTHNNKGKEYTKIVACTLHVKGLKKNLCVHTKAEGGFTLKFQDFPQTDPAGNNIENVAFPKAAHSELENKYDEDDIYNLELDFLNDDDWSEITAIWNWNIDENKQLMKQNKFYHQYHTPHQKHNLNHETPLESHRRLMKNEEMEFLFGKKNHNNNNNNNGANNWNNNNRKPGLLGRLFGGNNNNNNYQGGYQQPMMGGYGMNPMMHGMNPMMGGMNPMMNGMNPMMNGGMMNGGMMNGGMMNGGMMGGGMMSPMSHMFMQMMQMKLYMQMMKHLMPQHGHDCNGPCDSAETQNYADWLYDDYDHSAAFEDYNDLYDRYYNDYIDYNDEYSNYNRRLTTDEDYHAYYPYAGLTGNTEGGFQNMMNKVPQMMMNMEMMKSMGHIMKHTNPYIAMMMLHHMNNKHDDDDNHPMAMSGYNHMPMSCPSCMMGSRYMMNPMHLGMPGMMHMNPMMLSMMSGSMNSAMNGMHTDPMMMGLMAGMMTHQPYNDHHQHVPHALKGWLKMMKRGVHGPHSHNINVLSSMANMLHHPSNPMMNANLGYMMGRAVKKCQPLHNGLELCAMYNPMTNQLNVDVKAPHGKKFKRGKPKRLFPEKLSRMIKMLVKQRVFGNAGDELLGGELQRRFKHHVGMQMKPAAKVAKAPGAKVAAPVAPAAAQNDNGQFGAQNAGDMGASGVNMGEMEQMEGGANGRRLMEGEDLVQFDTMEGNIGYQMWRAELMDWHNFDDFEDEKQDFMQYGEYRNFGSFVHYFDTLELNWKDEDNWSDFDDVHSKSWVQFDDDAKAMDVGQKCGHKLPFLNFKLCSKVTENDISVFFKRTAQETDGAKTEYEDNSYYNQYLDTREYEWNDIQTLRDVIDYEFEHSLFRFNNDNDWHEIITSYSGSYLAHNNKRHLMDEDGVISGGSRLGEHDQSESEITLFGHLYRLKGISKCGGGDNSPMFCVGIHLGQPIKLPKAIQLPLTKMCNFMYIAKVCLGFDPNRMELKLSIQFQNVHKWKNIAKRILDIIKHLPHKTKRYIQWAARASADIAAKVVDDDVYEAEDDIIDRWYEDDGAWIVSAAAKVNANDVYWDDNEIWDDTTTITTDKGHDVERRCMHRMTGRRLCFCQFISWIDSQRYDCHRMEAMANEEVVASAKGMDIDMDNYINMYLDYDEYTMNEMNDDTSYGSHANMYGDMSAYYDIIGPQIKLDTDILDQYENEEAVFDANVVDKEDDNILYDDYTDDEVEIYDDIDRNLNDIYEEIEDELNAIDTKFSAADFYDSNYDSSNKEYSYDYDYYFSANVNDPKELQIIQQQEYSDHDAFVYNSLIQISSNLFWHLSILALLFGVFLCSLIYCYLKKRQQFVDEFRNNFNSFLGISQYCNKPVKYGFNPIHVALSHSDSNDSADEDDNNAVNECV